jgi:4'-phosphopantetheinyl transferase
MDVYWLEQTEADVSAEDDWLSAWEAARLAAMRFAKRRTDWRLGRWTAKCALAACLKTCSDLRDLAQIEIRSAASGAPEVFLFGQPSRINISLSHRAGVAACAVGMPGVSLGCDLEAVEPRSDAFVADYFTHKEQAFIASACTEDRALLINLLWSAKESALKALQEGLRLDTRCVAVSLVNAQRGREDGNWHPLRVVATSGAVFAGWWQCTGILVRTLVVAQPTSPPTPLTSKFKSTPVNTALVELPRPALEPFSRHDPERSEGERLLAKS